MTTQGRAVGYCVVAALQDPRKEVMSIRNLFPDRIAMRLDEPEQVDMVLGDGARDRGAAAELISSDPATGAGVAFVRLESDPEPGTGARRLGLRRRYPRHGRPVPDGRGRGGGCVNTTATTWRTDDPCPVCGTGLHSTDNGTAAVTQDCPLCGWSATWQVPRVVLSATQSDCLRDMLADAIAYHQARTGHCPVCRGHLAEDCAEHSPAWSLTEPYRSLVHDLDGEAA